MKSGLFSKIYQIVKKIPEGKVVTYGQIAKEVQGAKGEKQNGRREEGIDARLVGYALHANRDREVPCHRVVNRKGRVALNFAMGGWQEQRRRLKAEGVKFINRRQVDLAECKYQIPKTENKS